MASSDAISCDVDADIYPNVTSRRADEDGPVILPFARPEPRPIERWELVFVVDELPIQFEWERWSDDDAAACAHADHLIADPRCPGQSGYVRLTSLRSGAEAFPLTAAEVAARFGRGRRASRPRSRS